jgi:hypothetical protein
MPRYAIPVTRFPYRFAGAGPTTSEGYPVIYAAALEFTERCGHRNAIPDRVCQLMVVRSVDGHGVAYTNDPDFEWKCYLDESLEQARRIVRDGLLARLPWLRLVDA